MPASFARLSAMLGGNVVRSGTAVLRPRFPASRSVGSDGAVEACSAGPISSTVLAGSRCAGSLANESRFSFPEFSGGNRGGPTGDPAGATGDGTGGGVALLRCAPEPVGPHKLPALSFRGIARPSGIKGAPASG